MARSYHPSHPPGLNASAFLHFACCSQANFHRFFALASAGQASPAAACTSSSLAPRRSPVHKRNMCAVPRAWETLFVIAPASSSASISNDNSPHSQLVSLSDAPLLLLADILPTGVFAAPQALTHPHVLPVLKGERFPLLLLGSLGALAPETAVQSGESSREADGATRLRALLTDPIWPEAKDEDCVLTIALIGLGPVGVVHLSYTFHSNTC